MSIWSITGMKVFEETGFGLKRLDLSKLNPGMYYVKIRVGDENYTRSIQRLK